MKTIELIGHVDKHGRLKADVPGEVPPGPVRIALLVPSKAEEDEAGQAWAAGIAREWSDELADPREDIYTLDDGEPVNGAR